MLKTYGAFNSVYKVKCEFVPETPSIVADEPERFEQSSRTQKNKIPIKKINRPATDNEPVYLPGERLLIQVGKRDLKKPRKQRANNLDVSRLTSAMSRIIKDF